MYLMITIFGLLSHILIYSSFYRSAHLYILSTFNLHTEYINFFKYISF